MLGWPLCDLVNDAFTNYRVVISPNCDPFSQQKNEDVKNELREIELNEQAEKRCEGDNNQNNQNYSETESSQLHATLLSDSEINDKVRSLKIKQRQIFDFIYNWEKLESTRINTISSVSQAVEAAVNHI